MHQTESSAYCELAQRELAAQLNYLRSKQISSYELTHRNLSILGEGSWSQSCNPNNRAGRGGRDVRLGLSASPVRVTEKVCPLLRCVIAFH